MLSPHSSTPCAEIASSSLIDDVAQNGSISLSFFSNKHALGFRGDPDFIDRCFNLCVNRGIVTTETRLRWPNGPSSRFAYVIVRSKQRIIEGLTEQFRSEIIMRRQIAPLCECWDENEGYTVQWDEQAVGDLALHLATAFIRDHVLLDNFMARSHQLGPVYGVAEHYVGAIHSMTSVGDSTGTND